MIFSRSAGRPSAARCWIGIALAAVALAACAEPALTVEPAASQVARHLSQTAVVAATLQAGATATSTNTATATPTPQPSATATPSVTPTPSITATPSITPTPSETPEPTRVPRATVELGSLPRPPDVMAGDSHFLFSDPGLGFIASSYRYGSVGPGQHFAPHHGADFSAGAGAPVSAVAAGTVYYAGNDLERLFGPQPNFYGNLVVLQLAETWNGRTVYALYGHLDQVAVADGQPVNAGDTLGTVGATGVALGAHPHLEVRLDLPESYWDTRNPELWLQPPAGTGTLALRVTNAAGNYLPGVRVTFSCADAAPRFLETYWYNGVNPDDAYGENAAMRGLPPGFCDFEADIAGEKVILKDALIKARTVTFAWLKTSQ
jgi:murein DD-endopeptidase MepM/ murein hydrolase activator NlpD